MPTKSELVIVSAVVAVAALWILLAWGVLVA